MPPPPDELELLLELLLDDEPPPPEPLLELEELCELLLLEPLELPPGARLLQAGYQGSECARAGEWPILEHF